MQGQGGAMLVLQRKGGALLAFPDGDDAWSQLQGAPHSAGLNPVYRRLLAALDLGWQIEEPAYLLPRWGEGSPRVYHFILRHAVLSPPRLFTIPESPDIERFVHTEALEVVVSR